MDAALACEYEGDYLDGRYHGRGKLTYKHCVYEGTFMNGEMHGHGKLTVRGGYFDGYWNHGKLADGGFVFEDGLEHEKLGGKGWTYCSDTDPRFYSEMKDGIANGDDLRDITSHDYGLQTPKDCFDTIDGYYDPLKHAVYDYKTGEVVRTPNQEEIDWILKHCRAGKGMIMSGSVKA
mmetsp:Transcript_11908/g.19895  ORF Transcript_11908/g.19895 Transcript_11908/m.19895 type:complete len:177 (-) Transcript_11908:9-539(-)|eukprot:CAMPEP_0174963134 /NCGR_PEP_ID=MMETSP0004_2-20121128/5153_1 /TAXON_ID=420556 /ORGANISM="Ochromonas sp., Strain CCMP1393" /LENGTH=176 /DNA_ID=CAMNT_0016211709 /DNA_START=64 /DNA_END=594 /DNA_ORIENTATION=+